MLCDEVCVGTLVIVWQGAITAIVKSDYALRYPKLRTKETYVKKRVTSIAATLVKCMVGTAI